jgi:hypothetical protein
MEAGTVIYRKPREWFRKGQEKRRGHLSDAESFDIGISGELISFYDVLGIVGHHMRQMGHRTKCCIWCIAASCRTEATPGHACNFSLSTMVSEIHYQMRSRP